MTPDVDDLCVFAIKRGFIESKRIDVLGTHSSVIYNSIYFYPARKLGQIVSTFSGGTPSKKNTELDLYWNGTIPWVSPKDFKSFYLYDSEDHITEKAIMDSSTRIASSNSVLVVVRSGILKHTLPVAINKVEVTINQDIKVLIPNDSVLPEYLGFYLKVFETKILSLCVKHSTTVQSVNSNEFLDLDIPIPPILTQESLVQLMNIAAQKRELAIRFAKETLRIARQRLLSEAGVVFLDYSPSLYSYFKVGQIREMGLYCNPHSAYLNDVFSKLKSSSYYSGVLEDYVDINPSIDRAQLSDSSIVSFVPMPSVTEKTNQVVYEQRRYENVKTGFTPFQRGDLLWAKITPCMQNGKSFLSDAMPTEYGFGSTEFHVLRPKSDKIYMPFLWILLSDEHILEAAQGMFSGSAGQQRVPDAFLKRLPIVLPPLDIQKELANEVFAAMEQARKTMEASEQEWEKAKAQFERELIDE